MCWRVHVYGQGSPTLADRAKQVEFYRTHNRRHATEYDRSIFTRDKPGTSDPQWRALADVNLPFGDSVPTGTYLDMTANLPVVISQVHAPLMIVAENLHIATEEDLFNFISKLPYQDGSSGSAWCREFRRWHETEEFWHVMRSARDAARLDGRINRGSWTDWIPANTAQRRTNRWSHRHI